METRTDLLGRLAACLERGEDDVVQPAPVAAPGEVSPAIFVRQPVPLGHASQVRGNGDWFTHGVSGAPLLVVRGLEDGVLRGFLNVCRHQGNRVVGGDHGRGASGFQCTFHDWRYDTCGRLVGVPAPGRLPDGEVGLYAAEVAERHGLVVALPSAAASADVAAWLGALDDDLAGLDLGALGVERVRERTRVASWPAVAGLFVDPVRLCGWPDGRQVMEPVGGHLRFAAAPARTAPEALAEVAVRGWFLFPSTLVLARGSQVSLLSAFLQESGLVGWRHELLGRAGQDVDRAFAVGLEQRLFEAEGAPADRKAPGVAWLRARLA